MSIDDVFDEWFKARGKDACAAIEAPFKEIVRQQFEDEWGERCPDYEPGCPTCEGWARYDAMMEEGK